MNKDVANQREETLETQIISFKIGGVSFATYLSLTKEVINLTQSILPVPNVPVYVHGVINFKGVILAILDIIKIFGEEGFTKNSYRHIMVVEGDKKEAGILIDDVPHIFDVPVSSIKPAVIPKKVKWGQYVGEEVEVSGRYYHILDVGKILNQTARYEA